MHLKWTLLVGGWVDEEGANERTREEEKPRKRDCVWRPLGVGSRCGEEILGLSIALLYELRVLQVVTDDAEPDHLKD